MVTMLLNANNNRNVNVQHKILATSTEVRTRASEAGHESYLLL